MTQTRHPSDKTLPTGTEGPALVVGARTRVALAIARSLRRQGVRSVVVVPPGERWEVVSRAVSDVTVLSGSPETCVAQLSACAAVHRPSWIVPSSSSGLDLVTSAFGELRTHAPVASPPPAVVRRAVDREETLAAATRSGVPVFHPGAAFGDTVGLGVLLHRGAVVASFQQRRIRELPPAGGAAVVVESEPVDPAVLDHATRLLRELGWEGAAMVEFRRDTRAGRIALAGVTGHFWGSLPLAIRAGVDFPWLAWLAAHDALQVTPPAPVPYTVGLRVRWTAGSLLRVHGALTAPRDPANAGTTRTRAVADFLADFRPGTRSAVWSPGDPLPALDEPGHVIRSWIMASARRTARAFIPPAVVRAIATSRALGGRRALLYLGRQLARATGVMRPAELPSEIRTVMFVCHGNIMRSPTAAVMLREALATRGVNGVTITSSGVYARAGKRADPRMRAAASAAGISLDEHAAQPLTGELLQAADLVLVMDDLNYVDVATRFPWALSKTRLLGGISATGRYVGCEIPDPYTGGTADVETAVRTISGCIEVLASAIAARSPASITPRPPGPDA